MTRPAPPRRHCGRFEIIDSSMSPALEPGDYVITRRPGSRIERGTIVVVDVPGMRIVKRVVGLGGERVKVDGGVIAINDAVYVDDPWGGATRPDGAWEVDDDHLFILGDNRHVSSMDGRRLGSIHADHVIGIVVGRYWPLHRVGRKI